MSFSVVIPARYASTRLPGKPLELLDAKSMIEHVWMRASESGADQVIIATDDKRIEEACRGFGADVMMTDANHPSGTDRLAEVARRLDLAADQIVVNVQGDEPLIPPLVIDQVAANLAANSGASIATLCEQIDDVAVLRDPNAVKVVFNNDGLALYFSRACIPWPRGHDFSNNTMPTGSWYRHLGIYAYRVAFLRRYGDWHPSELEQLESLEQLRALHYGERIHVEVAKADLPPGIDTPEDLEKVRRYLASASS